MLETAVLLWMSVAGESTCRRVGEGGCEEVYMHGRFTSFECK